MRKKNATVWEVRFKNKTSSLFQDVGSSIEVEGFIKKTLEVLLLTQICWANKKLLVKKDQKK